jgi:membrane protein implicated in regulation of membrane protease activity
MELFEWYNLIFALPVVAALLYVVLMASGLSFGDHGDVSIDHDVGVDVGRDVSVGDVSHDVAGDLGHDADTGDADHAAHPHVLGAMLSLLGVGRAPLSILMMSACFIWGATGLVLNVLLGTDVMWQVVGFAALASLVGTRLVAEFLGSLLPGEESYHTPKQELTGEVAEVLYEVTPTSGTVRLQDPSGNLLDLACRSCGAEHIKAGTRVVLGKYDPGADLFLVRADENTLGK